MCSALSVVYLLSAATTCLAIPYLLCCTPQLQYCTISLSRHLHNALCTTAAYHCVTLQFVGGHYSSSDAYNNTNSSSSSSKRSKSASGYRDYNPNYYTADYYSGSNGTLSTQSAHTARKQAARAGNNTIHTICMSVAVRVLLDCLMILRGTAVACLCYARCHYYEQARSCCSTVHS
jgi:hypothetical protein